MNSSIAGVTFTAWVDEDFVPLSDLLNLLSPWIPDDGIWLMGKAEFAPGWRHSQELEEYREKGSRLTTSNLLSMVSDGIQMVDGQIDFLPEDGLEPRITLRSVRGDQWDVMAEDDAIINAILGRFPDAQPILY